VVKVEEVVYEGKGWELEVMEVERVEAGVEDVEDVEERRCGRVVEEVVEGRRD
jgi:hypothetical protein